MTEACSCRGYDAADPCGFADTSEGCPVHDPSPSDIDPFDFPDDTACHEPSRRVT